MMAFSLEKVKGKRRGFLLTEAILSLFILTIGLTSVVALISSSLKDSFSSRDTIIAVELAQEGAELVRNVRDNGFLSRPTDPFYNFSSNKHCIIDYDVNVITGAGFACSLSSGSSDDSYVVKYPNSGSGFYNQNNSGVATKFYRYVYVSYDGATKTAVVKSFVYWGKGTTGAFTIGDTGSSGNTASCTVMKKCVFTEIILTNWRG